MKNVDRGADLEENLEVDLAEMVLTEGSCRTSPGSCSVDSSCRQTFQRERKKLTIAVKTRLFVTLGRDVGTLENPFIIFYNISD